MKRKSISLNNLVPASVKKLSDTIDQIKRSRKLKKKRLSSLFKKTFKKKFAKKKIRK